MLHNDRKNMQLSVTMSIDFSIFCSICWCWPWSEQLPILNIYSTLPLFGARVDRRANRIGTYRHQDFSSTRTQQSGIFHFVSHMFASFQIFQVLFPIRGWERFRSQIHQPARLLSRRLQIGKSTGYCDLRWAIQRCMYRVAAPLVDTYEMLQHCYESYKIIQVQVQQTYTIILDVKSQHKRTEQNVWSAACFTPQPAGSLRASES